jgi:hypothetical protein
MEDGNGIQIGIMGLTLTQEQQTVCKHLSIHYVASAAETAPMIERHPLTILVVASGQARAVAGLQGLAVPWVVVTAEQNPRELRTWIAHGAYEVWMEAEWVHQLVQRFPQPATPIKKMENGQAPTDSGQGGRWLGTVVIGIGGVGRRTGTTHAAIQIARMLAVATHEKVALIEVLQQAGHPLQVLSTLAIGNVVDLPNGFRREGVDCYPNQTLQQYMAWIGADYTYIVADFGALHEPEEGIAQRLEFSRAHVKLLTVGGSLWDRLAWTHFVQQWKGKQTWTYLWNDIDLKQMEIGPWSLTDHDPGTEWVVWPREPQLWNVGRHESTYRKVLSRVLPQPQKRLWQRRK